MDGRRTTDRQKLTSGTQGAATEREMDPFPSMEKDPAIKKSTKGLEKREKSNNQQQQRYTYQCEKEKRGRESKREAGERPRSGRHCGCFFVVFLLFLIVSMWILKSI